MLSTPADPDGMTRQMKRNWRNDAGRRLPTMTTYRPANDHGSRKHSANDHGSRKHSANDHGAENTQPTTTGPKTLQNCCQNGATSGPGHCRNVLGNLGRKTNTSYISTERQTARRFSPRDIHARKYLTTKNAFP